jgi:cytochrome c
LREQSQEQEYPMSIYPYIIAASLIATGLPQQAGAQDADAGEKLFKQRCQACHSVVPGKVTPSGPNLLGVVGRTAGTTEFKYSDAMKQSGVVWDATTLDQFIGGPSKLIKGTRMSVSVTNAEQRASIVEYLSTLKN